MESQPKASSSSPTREGKAREDKSLLRLLRAVALEGGKALVENRGKEGISLDGERGSFRFPREIVESAIRRGLIGSESNRLALREEGQALLKRETGAPTPFAAQHRTETFRKVRVAGEEQTVRINMEESPLSRLRSHRAPDGKPWLDDSQFQAGERLRLDYEKALLRPSVSARWDRFATGRGSGSRSGGAEEISDLAMDARRRVTKALNCLDSSLAGVAVDICCHLKGMGQVERERQWPPRSAKLMLKTALSMLAGHYGLRIPERESPSVALHWGDRDYRPSL